MVREYTEKAEPVGSKVLAEKYGLKASSATIRSDMVILEEEGYLFQPHTSAGRIPTDKGYRYFVSEIMEDRELSLSEQKKLQAEFLKLKAQHSRMSRTMAKVLSSFSGSLAITGTEKEVYDFGIRELLENPEFQEVDEFCRVAEVLDYIDENIDKIFEKVREGETQIFIGSENPIKKISNCSMVVSPYKTKEGERAILALIGPKRMEYAKNKSLLDYVKNILGGSLGVVIFISNFN